VVLNGMIRDDELCRICGELGHRKYDFPSRSIGFKSDVLCIICGDGSHPTIDYPMKGLGKIWPWETCLLPCMQDTEMWLIPERCLIECLLETWFHGML
jgi:hypothetical protein